MPHGDVLYLVGPDERTDELRYSLRSLAAHVNHHTVWIAGHCPEWVTNVTHIPVEQVRSDRRNALDNLVAALAEPELSDPFMLWCDDFYAMRPIGDLPVMNAGLVREVIEGIPAGDYRAGIEKAAAHARSNGVAQPLCFDALHVPQWFTKTGLRATLDIGLDMYQTVYGNLHRSDPGVTVPNAKLPGGYQQRDWISTSLALWSSVIGQHVRDTFPNPCGYEA